MRIAKSSARGIVSGFVELRCDLAMRSCNVIAAGECVAKWAQHAYTRCHA